VEVLAPGYGLGVDNILEATIVLSDGSIVTANSKENSDLFWALRGGGGSNWGIITSITIKANKIPAGGFTAWDVTWTGNYCNNASSLERIVDLYSQWVLNQTSQIGGLGFFTPTYTGKASDCNGTWYLWLNYFYFIPSFRYL